VERKFVEQLDVSEWEVETEDGYRDIMSTNKTVEYEVYKLILENGIVLECADTHILIQEDYSQVFAKDSLGVGIRTKFGTSKVVSIEHFGEYEHMYDLSVDSKEHTYYTNGILSHNTTTVAAYILWYVLFNKRMNVGILAHKSSGAREVMSRFQLMFECLPEWLQQGVKTWNKGDIELENGSKVFTSATTSAGIRGKSVNLLYIDEAAIIPNTVAEAFFAASYPTISAGKETKIFMSSTPLGYNHFWKYWTEAEQGLNDFVALRIDYWEIPGRDQAWADEQRRNLGELKFTQEILCAFLGSSATLINADNIRNMVPIKPIHSMNGLDTFDKPTQNHVYVLVADVAKGVGGDYSAFSVMDITTVPYRQVAKYRDNKISPLLYPNIIYKVAKDYNMAWVLIEINVSEQVPHILFYEMEYENILFVARTNKGQQVSSGFSKGVTTLGVNTDKKVKRIGCVNFKTLVEENKILIQDKDTIGEIGTFIESKGSFAADDGYHDDLVMPLVLFAWFTSNPSFKDFSDIDLRKSMYEQRMQQIDEELIPVGFYSNGSEVDEEEIFNF
jgi:hypothetical protein